jgi:hypothetical protein
MRWRVLTSGSHRGRGRQAAERAAIGGRRSAHVTSRCGDIKVGRPSGQNAANGACHGWQLLSHGRWPQTTGAPAERSVSSYTFQTNLSRGPVFCFRTSLGRARAGRAGHTGEHLRHHMHLVRGTGGQLQPDRWVSRSCSSSSGPARPEKGSLGISPEEAPDPLMALHPPGPPWRRAAEGPDARPPAPRPDSCRQCAQHPWCPGSPRHHSGPGPA